MFLEKAIETLEIGQLKERQISYIKKSIEQAKKTEYYSRLLQKVGIKDIQNFEDFQNIPFTEKQDLRDNFPYGFLAVDLSEVVRLHSSSGTTGNPTVIFHTKSDLDDWAAFCARAMHMTGVRRNDVFQNIMGYGLFTGGLGFHYGSEKLGALTIPTGPGNSERQIWFMKNFKTTVMHILPNYALRLSSFFEVLEIDPKKDLHLKIAFLGAEPHSEIVRQKIEEIYGVKAYNSYGLSEMYGPGVAFECQYQEGMHLWEDYFYPEIIDPESGRVLPDGEEGELVLTTLRRQAVPLIRYRTRDLTSILPSPCKCGRTHRRISRIKGRTDDMLIINGVNLFPVQIERIIMDSPASGKNYAIEIKKIDHMDKLLVKVEVNRDYFAGTLKELEILQKNISARLKSEIGVNPEVKLVESGSLPVSEGKAKRVFDLRQEN